MTTQSSDLPGPQPEAARWRTSSFSAGGDCVSFADHGDHIAVRDSKDPDAGTLFLTRAEMRAWIQGVKAGEYDDLVGP
jgi:hypothetical protein